MKLFDTDCYFSIDPISPIWPTDQSTDRVQAFRSQRTNGVMSGFIWRLSNRQSPIRLTYFVRLPKSPFTMLRTPGVREHALTNIATRPASRADLFPSPSKGLVSPLLRRQKEKRTPPCHMRPKTSYWEALDVETPRVPAVVATVSSGGVTARDGNNDVLLAIVVVGHGRSSLRRRHPDPTHFRAIHLVIGMQDSAARMTRWSGELRVALHHQDLGRTWSSLNGKAST